MTIETNENHAQQCAQDALERYLAKNPHSRAKARIVSEHNQVWSDSAMGGGGIGLCVLTHAPTVVVQVAKSLFVYFNTYQYDIDMTTLTKDQQKRLKNARAKKNYPGKMEAHAIGGLINGKTYVEHQAANNFNGNY